MSINNTIDTMPEYLNLQLIDTSDEKLINAIVFFATEIQNFGKIKLLKLVFEMDKRHIIEVGRPIFNLNYQAWDMGPVSQKLYNSINRNDLPLNWKDYIELDNTNSSDSNNQVYIKPLKSANLEVFTPRQIKILSNLIEEFKFLNANDYVNATHKDGEPWSKAFARGKNSEITLTDILHGSSDFSEEKIIYEIETIKEIELNSNPF